MILRIQIRAEPLWQAMSMRILAFAMRFLLSLFLYLWLIFEQVFAGKSPFSNYRKDAGIILAVMGGKRPSRPPSTLDSASELDDALWDLISKGWGKDATLRPSVHDFVATLAQKLTVAFEPAPDWDNFRIPCSCAADPGQFLLASRSHKD
jgi:hypothetical protein